MSNFAEGLGYMHSPDIRAFTSNHICRLCKVPNLLTVESGHCRRLFRSQIRVSSFKQNEDDEGRTGLSL